jgi:hypothetical protein
VNTLWISIWLLLSAFIIGAYVWSTRILFEQKKAWKTFAAKYKLSYKKGKFFSSPEISGNIGNHKIYIYSEQQSSPDSRGARFRTVVEVMDKSTLPMSGAVASGDIVNLVANLELPHEVIPQSDIWSPQFLVRTDDKKKMTEYLSEDRLGVLKKLMKGERTAFLLIFNKEEILARFETGDPLHDPRRLDKLVKKMMGALEAMSYEDIQEGKAEAEKEQEDQGRKDTKEDIVEEQGENQG